MNIDENIKVDMISMTNCHSMDLFSHTEMVYSLNGDGIFIDVSPAWLTTSGYIKEDVVGHPFSEFISEDSRQIAQREFVHLKDYGFAHNVKLRLIRKQGDILDIIVNGTAKYNDDGSFDCSFCEVRTIDYYAGSTERVCQLLLQEKFFRMVGCIRANITSLLLKSECYYMFDSIYTILSEPSEVREVIIEYKQNKYFPTNEKELKLIEQIRENIKEYPFEKKAKIIKKNNSKEDEYTLIVRINDESMPDKERLILIDFISQKELLSDWTEEFNNIAKLIESVVQMINVHAEIQRLVGELQLASETDKLTGISNRAVLEKVLIKSEHSYDRYKKNTSIIMFDIDFFKKINDTYGHNAGDSVLKEISTLVRGSIRRTDVFGRWGGEEFILICENTPVSGAKVLADKLRRKIECYPFSNGIIVTASFGIAEFSDGLTKEGIVGKADEALYMAKKSGRNRVCCIE